MKIRLFVLLLVVLFSFVGCAKETILTGVSSKASIDVIVQLQRLGVSAWRENIGGKNVDNYQIKVDKWNYARALEILHSYNLPRTDENDIIAITKPEGFLPNSPEMSAFRLDYALSMQIEKIIGAFPGVVNVKAVVRSSMILQEQVDYSSQADGSLTSEPNSKSFPSASVVIKYIPDAAKIPFSVKEVQESVEQMIPGIEPANIKISTVQVLDPAISVSYGAKGDGSSSVVPLTQLYPFNFFVPVSETSSAKTQIVVAVLVVLVSAAILFLSLGWNIGTKRMKSRMVTGGAQAPVIRIEEERKPQLE